MGVRIEAWSVDGVVLERYRYGPGPAVAYPRHAHEEYQVCLNLELPGRVWYRRAWHTIAPRSLTVVAPQEVHETRDPDDRPAGGRYRVFYLDPAAVDAVAGAAGRPASADLLLPAGDLFDRFLTLHRAYQEPESRLTRDCLAQAALAALLDGPGSEPAPARREARRARDYLMDNLTANVSLAELARVASLSPYHLARTFASEFGLPPHAYQIQARIGLARRLLLAGRSATQVAYATGFYDPSHFARHFTRVVGVPPGGYGRSARTYKDAEPAPA
ncbi:AraC family transcriptional regulator [Phytohabitans houttuyneae]|uniref:AraC family transcriptional regulator n=1 Tax=Phytohabitans houttuyneae TaxID=1076126 RepID=UPI001565D53B|nr:AraC family transcriptional regulator [Phytohabitans houttuyneae]